jgi:hypothetical protein
VIVSSSLNYGGILLRRVARLPIAGRRGNQLTIVQIFFGELCRKTLNIFVLSREKSFSVATTKRN